MLLHPIHHIHDTNTINTMGKTLHEQMILERPTCVMLFSHYINSSHVLEDDFPICSLLGHPQLLLPPPIGSQQYPSKHQTCFEISASSR